MKRLAMFMASVAGLLASPGAFSDCLTGATLFAHPELQTKSVAFKDYEIRLYGQKSCEAEPESRVAGFEIRKAGKRVYIHTGYSFAIGYPLEQNQSPDSVKVPVGTDITGEGLPDLLMSEWSGGAHCCYSFHLFRLGESFSRIQSLPLFDADESSFVKREGVKGLVLNTADYSAFAYFPSSFADSPAGRVLLSFRDGKFRLDASLMEAAAPTAAEIGHCASLFKQSRDWKDGQSLGMWYYATDLIYTGHMAEAWSFLDTAWGGSETDKKHYLGEYREHLKKSIYYPELMELQQAKPSAANQTIDWTKQCFEYMHG
jgi:hypothetical protein